MLCSSSSISSGSGTYLFTYLMTGALESVQQWDVVLHCSSSSSSSSRSGTYLFIDRCCGVGSAAAMGQLLETVQGGARTLLLPADGTECRVGAGFSQRTRSCCRLPLSVDTPRHFTPLLLRPPAQDTCHHRDGETAVKLCLFIIRLHHMHTAHSA